MEFLNAFINWLTHPTWQSEIIIAAVMCLILYTICKNRNEFELCPKVGDGLIRRRFEVA